MLPLILLLLPCCSCCYCCCCCCCSAPAALTQDPSLCLLLLLSSSGTGKTLLARACAKNTDAVFLKISGPQLVQMFIGDGAKLVRDAFDLAKEKIKKEGRNGAIIFIDELDAIGTKRYGGDQAGDREVQRTMLELLNQLDGFSSNEKVPSRAVLSPVLCCAALRHACTSQVYWTDC